jgi:hypothetical protein
MRDVFCDPGTESTPLTLVTQAEFQNSLDGRDNAFMPRGLFHMLPGRCGR